MRAFIVIFLFCSSGVIWRFYKNLFLTRKQTDHAWYLILARVKKGEATPDNKASKAAPIILSTATIKLSVRTWKPDCQGWKNSQQRGFCIERRNLPPGSKRGRLCLVCQAVENMFTSWSRLLCGQLFWLPERMNWPEVYWGRAASCVCCYF